MSDTETEESIYEIDLHGLSMNESKMVLDEVFEYIQIRNHILKLHIVVGQGKGSTGGPILPAYVGNYIRDRGLNFTLENGVLMVNVI